MQGSRKRDTSPSGDTLDSNSAKRICSGMVEDSKVSLGSVQEDAKQGPLQSDSSFHRNTDTSDGVNSLHVFQDDIDIKAVRDNAYSKRCGPQQLIVEIFSGSCRLSKACRKVGFRTTAVDKSSERSENFTIYK